MVINHRAPVASASQLRTKVPQQDPRFCFHKTPIALLKFSADERSYNPSPPSTRDLPLAATGQSVGRSVCWSRSADPIIKLRPSGTRRRIHRPKSLGVTFSVRIPVGLRSVSSPSGEILSNCRRRRRRATKIWFRALRRPAWLDSGGDSAAYVYVPRRKSMSRVRTTTTNLSGIEQTVTT